MCEQNSKIIFCLPLWKGIRDEDIFFDAEENPLISTDDKMGDTQHRNVKGKAVTNT